MASSRKICVGQFTGAHGVRGLVKLRSFTAEPESIFDYAPLSSQDGKRVFKIALKSSAKDHFIITVDGIANKEEADALRGDKVFISRDALPKTRKGEYYEGDLLGLAALDAEGKDYGTVMGIHDHGAGVFLEIGTSRKDSFMLPFKDAFVPEVDLKTAKLVIAVPEGWL
jgi:16S rRNA processing protein RimM